MVETANADTDVTCTVPPVPTTMRPSMTVLIAAVVLAANDASSVAVVVCCTATADAVKMRAVASNVVATAVVADVDE